MTAINVVIGVFSWQELKVIGSCNCPITTNCLITLSDYHFSDQLMPNTAAYAPITLEESVMAMTIRYLDLKSTE